MSAEELAARAGAAEAAPARLPRLIGAGTMAAVIVGTIIGSGIFRTPADIAGEMGSVWGIALIWIVGGIVTLCLALSLAELATMFPRSGGLYVYLREAFGPGVAFVYIWTFLLINPSNWAAISLIFAESLGRFVDIGPAGKRLAAAALVVFVSTVNYVSVRFAGRIQDVATTAKALALGAIALVIFALADGAGGAFGQPAATAAPTLGAFGVALVMVLWPYEGVAGSCALAGEVREPHRSLPRALILSVLLVMVLYLAINAAYLYALPVDRVAASELVAADAMRAAIGPGAGLAVAACIMLATFGAVAAASISDPRVFYASARDGLFFERTGRVHPRFVTPHVAIVLSGLLAIAYLSVRTFEELAAQFVLGMWLFYLLAVVGLVVLRIRRPAQERPYRVPFYPLVPGLVILGAGWLLVNSLLELPAIALLNVAVSAAGIPVYWAWKRLRRQSI